jgi:hypothetical protein
MCVYKHIKCSLHYEQYLYYVVSKPLKTTFHLHMYTYTKPNMFKLTDFLCNLSDIKAHDLVTFMVGGVLTNKDVYYYY